MLDNEPSHANRIFGLRPFSIVKGYSEMPYSVPVRWTIRIDDVLVWFFHVILVVTVMLYKPSPIGIAMD